MAKQSWTRFRGVVQPVLGNEPLVIQLSKVFVANLRLILNVAMVFGAVFLAQELRESSDDVPAYVEHQQVVQEQSPDDSAFADEDEEPVLSEGVMHALNCTYEDYLKEHYAECVEDGSEIYRPIEADPDDAGYLFDETPILFAMESVSQQY